MSANRFMSTILCDDVRREEGRKVSYMGVYGTNIVVPSFPCTLPKLCFVMSLVTPADQEAPDALTFRVFKDDDLLAEVSVPPEALRAAAAHAKEDVARDSKRLTFGTVVQVFPVQFASSCTLKARAECDSVEIKGGSWPVESMT